MSAFNRTDYVAPALVRFVHKGFLHAFSDDQFHYKDPSYIASIALLSAVFVMAFCSATVGLRARKGKKGVARRRLSKTAMPGRSGDRWFLLALLVVLLGGSATMCCLMYTRIHANFDDVQGDVQNTKLLADNLKLAADNVLLGGQTMVSTLSNNNTTACNNLTAAFNVAYNIPAKKFAADFESFPDDVANAIPVVRKIENWTLSSVAVIAVMSGLLALVGCVATVTNNPKWYSRTVTALMVLLPILSIVLGASAAVNVAGSDICSSPDATVLRLIQHVATNDTYYIAKQAADCRTSGNVIGQPLIEARAALIDLRDNSNLIITCGLIWGGGARQQIIPPLLDLIDMVEGQLECKEDGILGNIWTSALHQHICSGLIENLNIVFLAETGCLVVLWVAGMCLRRLLTSVQRTIMSSLLNQSGTNPIYGGVSPYSDAVVRPVSTDMTRAGHREVVRPVSTDMQRTGHSDDGVDSTYSDTSMTTAGSASTASSRWQRRESLTKQRERAYQKAARKAEERRTSDAAGHVRQLDSDDTATFVPTPSAPPQR